MYTYNPTNKQNFPPNLGWEKQHTRTTVVARHQPYDPIKSHEKDPIGQKQAQPQENKTNNDNA